MFGVDVQQSSMCSVRVKSTKIWALSVPETITEFEALIWEVSCRESGENTHVLCVICKPSSLNRTFSLGFLERRVSEDGKRTSKKIS